MKLLIAIVLTQSQSIPCRWHIAHDELLLRIVARNQHVQRFDIILNQCLLDPCDYGCCLCCIYICFSRDEKIDG